MSFLIHHTTTWLSIALSTRFILNFSFHKSQLMHQWISFIISSTILKVIKNPALILQSRPRKNSRLRLSNWNTDYNIQNLQKNMALTINQFSIQRVSSLAMGTNNWKHKFYMKIDIKELLDLKNNSIAP